MKSKLKRNLRLKIAILTLVLVCGFLLGFNLQRDKKGFTASADTIEVSSVPFIVSSRPLSGGSFDIYTFSSSTYGREYRFTSPNSLIKFYITAPNNTQATEIRSGSTVYFNSEKNKLRVENPRSNSIDYSFEISVITTPLSTPVVSLVDGEVLSWNPVPNAVMYEIYKNGTYLTGTSTTAVNLSASSSFGNGDYQVRAIPDSDDTAYTASELSNTIVYNGGYKEALDEPVLSYNRYILSWNFIVNADTFYIYYSFNGTDYELEAVVNSLSYSPSTNGFYYVIAHPFNTDYSNSAPSNIVNITNLSPTSSDNILHGILSAANDFLNLRLFGDNSVTIGFLFSLGITGLMLGVIIRLFFHG